MTAASGGLPVSLPVSLPLSLHQDENLPPGFARAVNVPILAARFGTGLDPGRLAAAFEAVQGRHQALRLRLITGEDGPRQLIEPAAGRVERLSLPGSPSEPQLAEEFQRVLAEPRDLAVDGPVVARLYEFDGGYAALLAVTHVAADGWSVGVLNRDLAALYSRAPLPELPPDYYRDYVLSQAELGPFLTDRQTEFFAGLLTGVPVLPLRRALPAEPATAYRAQRRPLPLEVAGSVYELAGRLRTTPAKLLMAATFLALKDYFGADTFAVLDVSAARGREQLDWVGLLSKGVPVPVPSSAGLTAGEFVARVHRQSLRALSMLAGPYSLKRVLALLASSRLSPAATELHRRHWSDQAPAGHSVMFNCLTIAPPAAEPFGPGVDYRPLYLVEPLAAEKNRISDLDVLPLIDGTAISLGITAHPAVHDEADVERVLATLEAILTGWANDFDPDRPLG